MNDQHRDELPADVDKLAPDQVVAICKLIEAGPRLVKHLSEDGSITHIQAGEQRFQAPEFIKAIQLMYRYLFVVVAEPQPLPPQPMRTVTYAVTSSGRDFLVRHKK